MTHPTLTPAALDRLAKLSQYATEGHLAATHNLISEESRLWIGAHQRAVLDGRLMGGQINDAELLADLWNHRHALIASARLMDRLEMTITCAIEEAPAKGREGER